MTDLRVEAVSVGRGGRPLLARVAFQVLSGKALALRGPNGLGKTSLLRTLAGLQPPLAGTLSHDIDAVAYAGHAPGLKGALTVAENLRFWRAIAGPGAGPDLAEVMEAFGLQHLQDRPAAALSAGQRQRCALARLPLLARPLWLLDEPATALDDAGQGQLARALEAHLKDGGVAVLVSHGPPPISCPSLDLAPFAGEASLPSGAGAFEQAVE